MAVYKNPANIGGGGGGGGTGATGAKGDKGDPGVAGAIGATGAAGVQGIQGAVGLTGATGAAGATGAKGDKGDLGNTGATGSQGAQGIQGLTGSTGATGNTGSPGANGTSFTNVMTASGDTIYGAASGNATRLPVGTTGQVLSVVAGLPAWQTPSGGGYVNPLTALGDILVGGASGTQARLGIGANSQVLGVVGGNLQWVAATAGATGATGATGAKGDPGNTGAQGVQGLTGSTGATGAQGIQGLTGTTGTNGASDNPRGVYSAGATYARRDIVSLNGASYYWSNSTAGNTLPPSADWLTLADKGATGNTGAQGTAGTNGTNATNPMVSPGDMIVGGAGGTPTRLALGIPGYVLTATGTVPTWTAPAAAGGGYASTFTDVLASGLQAFGSFSTVAFTQVIGDSGNNFNLGTSFYTVPTAGIYQITGTLRLNDGSAPGANFGVGVNTSNADGAWFLWHCTQPTNNVYRRTTYPYIRVVSLPAGVQLRMFTYSDEGLQMAAVAMQIIRIA